jgi:hypothetical protein
MQKIYWLTDQKPEAANVRAIMILFDDALAKQIIENGLGIGIDKELTPETGMKIDQR